jgi:CubicO group peptidase (beta-lactamase class C family)
MKHCTLFLPLILVLLYGCNPKPEVGHELALHTYHDPSFGWTASIPVDWSMCNVPGGQFVRDLPLKDPTKLIVWTYRNKTEDAIRADLQEAGGVIHQDKVGEQEAPTLRWRRYRADARSDAKLTVEFALATDHQNTHLILLVAPQAEADALVDSVLLPAIDSFLPGPADPPVSVLAVAPPEPDTWPTQGWRTAWPESQGMDPDKLNAMLALIRSKNIPLNSLTIVRHGYLVLDEYFPPFEASDLHELHSATKSVTSALVGIALHDAQLAGEQDVSIDTPALDILSSRRAAYTDSRKRALTLEHLLSMTAGLDWSEWDAPYEPGTGNDLVQMIDSAPDWTQYVLDRPMAADPGTTFLYNSGASHLLSAIVTELSGKRAVDLAAERLFTPLGIHDYEWVTGPEGVTAGWGNLRVHPTDLARIGLLYLQRGKWDGEQIVPADWVEASTTDHVPDPFYEYGYQWWLDLADGYAFMAGRFGQVAIVAPRQDMVIVFTSHLPDTVGDVGVTRWLAERFILSSVEQNTD